MNSLEKKRIQRELHGVSGARFDMEIRIEEMQNQIKELQKHLDIQIAKEIELEEKLKQLQ